MGNIYSKSDELKNWSAAFQIHFNKIKDDLKANVKKNHWIWYIFPTSKPGANDPHKVKVNSENIKEFLKLNDPQYLLWFSVIQDISTKDKKFIPKTDSGRINYFMKEWYSLVEKSDKSKTLLPVLNKIKEKWCC